MTRVRFPSCGSTNQKQLLNRSRSRHRVQEQELQCLSRKGKMESFVMKWATSVLNCNSLPPDECGLSKTFLCAQKEYERHSAVSMHSQNSNIYKRC